MKVYKFYCESCGSKQYIKTKQGYKCKYCGNVQDVISDVALEERNHDENNPEVNHQDLKSDKPKSRFTEGLKLAIIHLIVCFYFGVLGVHKFMEKKFGLGIVYLLTFGLFGVGWLIDVVKYGLNIVSEWHASGGKL